MRGGRRSFSGNGLAATDSFAAQVTVFLGGEGCVND